MKYCTKCANELQRQLIDGVERPYCSACGHTVWNNPTPVVAGLVKYNDQYVVARNTGWPKRIYSVITGYLEAGEEPEGAIAREVNEELGLVAQQQFFIGHYMFQPKNQLIIAYAVTASGNIQLNHELADFRLLSFEALKEYDFSPLSVTQSIVNDWLSAI